MALAGHQSRVPGQMSWLDGNLEPGDHLVAGTFGQVGRAPRWEQPLMHIAIAPCALGASWFFWSLSTAGAPPDSLPLLVVAPVLLTTLPRWLRDPMCIAVTTRYVFLVRMTSNGRKFVRIESRTPLASVSGTDERAGYRRRIIRLAGPYFPKQGLQFLVTGGRRADLDGVLAAISAGHDAVEPPPAAAASQNLRW